VRALQAPAPEAAPVEQMLAVARKRHMTQNAADSDQPVGKLAVAADYTMTDQDTSEAVARVQAQARALRVEPEYVAAQESGLTLVVRLQLRPTFVTATSEKGCVETDAYART
jgi:hypothetical protein